MLYSTMGIIFSILWVLFIIGWAILSIVAVIALWRLAIAHASLADSVKQIASRRDGETPPPTQ